MRELTFAKRLNTFCVQMINTYVIAHGQAAVDKYTALPKAGPSDLAISQFPHKYVNLFFIFG